jgi:hypothetical protein
MALIDFLGGDRNGFGRCPQLLTIKHGHRTSGLDPFGLNRPARRCRRVLNPHLANLTSTRGRHALNADALIDDGIVAAHDIIVDDRGLVVDFPHPPLGHSVQVGMAFVQTSDLDEVEKVRSQTEIETHPDTDIVEPEPVSGDKVCAAW